MSAIVEVAGLEPVTPIADGALVSGRRGRLLRQVWALPTGRVGLLIVGFIVLLAIIGPHVVPYNPTSTLGSPYAAVSGTHWLGTDGLGRDVFSRVLDGGGAIIGIAVLSTALAYAIAIPIGMATGLRHGRITDAITLGLVDLALAFPPIVFILALLSAAGSGFTIVVVAIACVHIPRVVRVVRAVAVEVSAREFVEAAVARGEHVWSVLWREILPNIWTPTLADFGLRLTGSIVLYASLSYLGLAQQPPAANWGLMISENRDGLFINPWALLVPAALIAILSIGANLVADAVARSIGRSIDDTRS